MEIGERRRMIMPPLIVAEQPTQFDWRRPCCESVKAFWSNRPPKEASNGAYGTPERQIPSCGPIAIADARGRREGVKAIRGSWDFALRLPGLFEGQHVTRTGDRWHTSVRTSVGSLVPTEVASALWTPRQAVCSRRAPSISVASSFEKLSRMKPRSVASL